MTRSAVMLWTGLGLTVVVAVVLGMQNRALKVRTADLERMLRWPEAGMLVPPVAAETADGRPVRLGAPGSGTAQVLLFYTLACDYCAQMLPHWKRLAETLAPLPNVQVLGVQLDSAEHASRARHAVPYAVVSLPDPWTLARVRAWYRVGGVPLTLVVDSAGRVAHVTRGLIEDPTLVDSIVTAAREVVPDAESVSLRTP